MQKFLNYAAFYALVGKIYMAQTVWNVAGEIAGIWSRTTHHSCSLQNDRICTRVHQIVYVHHCNKNAK